MKSMIIVAEAMMLASCASLTDRADIWLATPEVRVYADRGVTLLSGGKGGAVQIYGVRVMQDGSEVVVWKHFMWDWNGLLFDHHYDIILDDTQEHAYLRFKAHKQNTFFKFNRASGRLVETVAVGNPVYAALEKRIPVTRMMVNRPEVPECGRQTMVEAQE